jgi:hypothetical protein
MIQDSTVLPSDRLTKNSLTYFHGNTSFITHTFYKDQIKELADAVNEKLENDLAQFMSSFQLDQTTADSPNQKNE